MVHISAQGNCTITPINPTTLTAAGGVILIGTENVTIRCNCTDDYGTVIKVRWYNATVARLPDTLNRREFLADAPHFIRNVKGDDTNIILVIPTFNDSYDGIYTCGRLRRNNYPPGAPNATVNLNIGGEYISMLSH